MKVNAAHESWPLAGAFRIARGVKTSAEVVVASLEQDGIKGRGECVPYARYGETLTGVLDQVNSVSPQQLTHDGLIEALPPGAARNALDCALWDYECKRDQQSVSDKLSLVPTPVSTCYTLSLDKPEAMHQAALKHRDKPLLKVKLGGAGDIERLQAIRTGAPDSRLVVDANESWSTADYEALLPELVSLQVDMIEQPFPAAADQDLAKLDRPIPICADESCHDSSTVPGLEERYDMVNIKLDKTGGLSEALETKKQAMQRGLKVMVGCMVSTSLSMAPAFYVAQGVDIVDLDGPLWLKKDRSQSIRYDTTVMQPPTPRLWG